MIFGRARRAHRMMAQATRNGSRLTLDELCFLLALLTCPPPARACIRRLENLLVFYRRFGRFRPRHMKSRPNIVLCTCDQLRAFETGCYGNEVVRTPNVDRLAREGVRFETAVTNFPVCMAARSVLMSGQFNRTCTGGVANFGYPIGRDGFYMPEYPEAGRPHCKDRTLPEVLRDHGYRNTVIGKWHIHSWPQDVGFDEYLIPRVHHCHTGQSYTENGGPEFVPEGYSVEFEADRVEQFLADRREARDPFFLYYNISVPHCPLDDAPEEFRGMYDPEDIPLRANVDPERPLADQDYHFKVYRHDFRYYQHHLPCTETLPDGYTLRHLIAEYYGMTTWMDAVFGRMLAALDRHGLADDTIVVFTSDHGDNLGSHGLVQKNTPNEESIRIPLLVRGPSVGAGPSVVRDRVASLVDLAPTLLSFLGVETPDHFHGRDLSAPCAPEAFVETSGGAAVRTTSHLYYIPFEAERSLAAHPGQMFDLAADPFELRNLTGENPLPPPAAELDEALRDWDRRTPWMEER
jgi:arylsulfatase A-like enzyme